MHTREEKLKAFGRMLDVVDTLREKCPWDRKQTNESLRPNTIEEVFELADAISKSDTHNICKELGDVLLHICFYSRIGSETGDFDIADVCNALVDKLIFRHPHVYHPSQIGAPDPKPLPYGEEKADNADGEEVKTAQQVIQNWEQPSALQEFFFSSCAILLLFIIYISFYNYRFIFDRQFFIQCYYNTMVFPNVIRIFHIASVHK